MLTTLSYGIKFKTGCSESNTIFNNTISLYTKAVEFLCRMIDAEWSTFCGLTTEKAVILGEQLCHITKDRPVVKYDFDKKFPDMPCYLRRSAISKAFGKISSYRSNLKNWETSNTQKSKPKFPAIHNEYPNFYYGNMFYFTDKNGKRLPDGEISCYACIKVFCNQRQLKQDKPYDDKFRKKLKDNKKAKLTNPDEPELLTSMVWDWMPVVIKKSDYNYLLRLQADGFEILTPSIRRKQKGYALCFAVSKKINLSDTDILNQTILSVDLGINNPATCSVMRSDGAILARRFMPQSRYTRLLEHKLGLVRRAQSHGSRKNPVLWRMVNNANENLALETVQFIMSVATEFNVDVIVFEHLDLSGKKKGSKKQRLQHWRAKYIQERVTGKAHTLGIRIARVCAWGTSRLAFDGTGKVIRGKEAGFSTYSLCRFQGSDKVYNCDLNATYNIGARYFIRELLKAYPVTDESVLKAKVPEVLKRSTCTLSTLIRLNAVLFPSGNGIPSAVLPLAA